MHTPDTDTLDREDMQRLVSGKEAALNDLMSRHATGVFQFLCRLLGNEADAADLAQETFVRVYRSRDSYRPDHPFRTWLLTIAANLARNHLRWRSRHPALSLDATSDNTEDTSLADVLPAKESSPADAADQAERIEIIRAAVQHLPPDLREAIVLCEWEDMTLAEAAVICNTTPKAIETRLYRARQQLRQQLGGMPWN